VSHLIKTVSLETLVSLEDHDANIKFLAFSCLVTSIVLVANAELRQLMASQNQASIRSSHNQVKP